jgi:hypothetical protein
LNEHPALPPGTLVADKFRIERLLGAGAMGSVYRIDHELTHNKRALKLLHPTISYSPEHVRRFLSEASAAGRAGNPHLVETFDAGILPTGEPYLVMELLDGEPLDAMLERERTLSPALAAELVAQAAEGIDAAHRVGIIHRDLKPANLFVTTREDRPFIKIMDFGVSKFSSATTSSVQQTRAGVIIGSPAYMSPEQLRGELDLDARGDVFSLAVVLYECLSGVLPFDAPTLHALMARVLSGSATPLATLRPELPRALVEVVEHALANDRDVRIPNAMALADALSSFRVAPTTTAVGAATVALAEPAAPAAPAKSKSKVPYAAALGTLLLASAVVGLAVRANAPAVAAQPVTAPPSSTSIVQTAAAPVAPVLLPLSAPTAEASAVQAAAIHASKPTLPQAEPPRGPRLTTSATASAAPQPSKSSGAQDLGLAPENPYR